MSIIGSNILAGASGQGVGGYTIETSLRFRASASAYLSRTFGTPTNNKIWTWSGWVKKGKLTSDIYLFAANNSTATEFIKLSNSSSDAFEYAYWNGSAWAYQVRSTMVLRDPSAWYHLVVSVDTTQATASNRVRLYVNGVQVTSFSISSYPSQNTNTKTNSAVAARLGSGFSSAYFDGYLTEINFIDGQALDPSSFGEYNADTGVWQPVKYAGTYGTNGFYLPFNDATTTTTLTADESGNGNDWTANNISLTSGVTYDSMTDTPTPYADGGNYAVLNPLNKGSNITLSGANLNVATAASSGLVTGTIGYPSTGKWYWEYTALGGAENLVGVVVLGTPPTSPYVGQTSGGYGYYGPNGNKYNSAVGTAYGASYTTNDVIGVAFDSDTRELVFYKNNSSQGVAYTVAAGSYFPAIGTNTAGNGAANFGQRPFAYTPPTGFLPLHTGNLPDSTIVDGSQYFNVDTYAGTGATNARTIGFQPDFVWIKARTNAYWHKLFDSVRGANKPLVSNDTTSELTETTGLMSFDSDGFTLGTSADSTVNNSGSGQTYVAWNWKEGASAGFDIVTFTSDGVTAGGTFAHNLGVAPKVVIYKGRNTDENWHVYHESLGAGNAVYLNLTSASNATGTFNNTAPTSSVIQLRQSSWGAGDVVAYCFAEVEGYSKFDSYLGNNSSDGVFVYLGFRPRFLMIKSTSAGTEWVMIDTERSPYNLSDTSLYANRNYSEATITAVNDVDILSNGFKLRNNTGYVNASQTYIYMAFAESPFKVSLAR